MELDDHVRRILRSEFATGIVDDPVQKSVVDPQAGFDTARKIAEQSSVLLKNNNNLLPLDGSKVRSIAIIGEKADTGMLSGAGSAQVDPPGPPTKWQEHVWFPTSPLKAIKAKAVNANVRFDTGADPATAAALAKQSDVAIVFVNQWQSEGMDLPDLSLPNNQDKLVEQVAAANPRTVVERILAACGIVCIALFREMYFLDKSPALSDLPIGSTTAQSICSDLRLPQMEPSCRVAAPISRDGQSSLCLCSETSHSQHRRQHRPRLDSY